MADRYTAFRDKLPKSYVEFIETSSGWCGDLGEEIEYVDLWNREELQENFDGYQMAEFLTEADRWFPFGSNGGGEMLAFDLQSKSDAVYWLPFIGMDGEEAMRQDYSFGEIVTTLKNRH